MTLLKGLSSSVTPLPEDQSKGQNIHSQLQSPTLLHRLEQELRNLLANKEFEQKHNVAYLAVSKLVLLLQEDSNRARAGQERHLTINDAQNLVNECANDFNSLEDPPDADYSSAGDEQLQTRIALYSKGSTMPSKGGGRPRNPRNQRKGGGKNGNSDDPGSGKPRKPRQHSQTEKAEYVQQRAALSSSRSYGTRTPPDLSNSGGGENKLADLIMGSMYLYAALARIVSHPADIAPANQLDHDELLNMFDWISLCRDAKHQKPQR